MVTIGFICEGITDFYFLNSTSFKAFLESINVISIPPKVIQGSGNLKNKNKLKTHLEILFKRGANFVFVLTDLDAGVCITKTKEAVDTGIDNQITIIAVKELEAWILADESNMSSF